MRAVRSFALLASPATLALSACAAADTVARQQAKTVVNSVVESRFPGVNVAPVTDCVIDAASATEIASIARAANGAVTPQTVETVIDIATRPESVDCIAENGLGLLVRTGA